MDDIADKISELLADPDGMNRIMSMAQSLFSDKTETDAPKKEAEPNPNPDSDSNGGFSLPKDFDIGKIMGLMSAFNSQKNDRRSELLLALKPHLSQERREKVDKAVKLLKIISLMPVLREQGLLDII